MCSIDEQSPAVPDQSHPDEVFIRDSASNVLTQLADVLDRLTDKLSPTLLARVSNALECIVDSIEGSGELLRVVTSELDSVAAGAGDYVTDVVVTDRCRDLVTALCAFDRDLELVCKTHGFLSEQSSLVKPPLHSYAGGQGDGLRSESAHLRAVETVEVE